MRSQENMAAIKRRKKTSCSQLDSVFILGEMKGLWIMKKASSSLHTQRPDQSTPTVVIYDHMAQYFPLTLMLMGLSLFIYYFILFFFLEDFKRCILCADNYQTRPLCLQCSN